jgi:hypothetical protein
MPRFKPNVPVRTEKPVVQVDTTGMAAGEYKFQLVVVDDRGRESQPATVTIRIGDGGRLRPSDTIVLRPQSAPVETKPDKPSKSKTPRRKSKGDTQ